MKIVRPLVLLQVKFDINLRSEHIPGINNVLPDLISRFKVNDSILRSIGMELTPTPIPRHLQPEHSLIL